MILKLSAATAPSRPRGRPTARPLTKAACQRTPACTWVDPYKRLDDVKVKGFCRPTTPQPAKPDSD